MRKRSSVASVVVAMLVLAGCFTGLPEPMAMDPANGVAGNGGIAGDGALRPDGTIGGPNDGWGMGDPGSSGGSTDPSTGVGGGSAGGWGGATPDQPPPPPDYPAGTAGSWGMGGSPGDPMTGWPCPDAQYYCEALCAGIMVEPPANCGDLLPPCACAAPGWPLPPTPVPPPPPLPSMETCALGIPADAVDTCPGAIALGLCFRTASDACACLGCPDEKCGVSVSAPTEAFCR